MKLRGKTLAFLLAVVFMFTLAGCFGGNEHNNSLKQDSTGSVVDDNSDIDGNEEENVDFSTYQSYWLPQFDYKTMPIAGFNGCPPNKEGYSENFTIKEQTFKDIKDSGINTVYGLYDTINVYQEEVLTALDYCDIYGLSYISAFTSAYSQKNPTAVKSAYTKAKYKPALGGVIIRDEPGKNEFQQMAKSRKIFESVIPDKLYHGNLFPIYASAHQLYTRGQSHDLPEGGYDYNEYVADYIEAFKPQILSYDFYPLSGGKPNLSNSYFVNMSIIREQALKAKIPFWVYIATCSYSPAVRIPDQSEINWMVNTSLTYGAKGIQYFTYFLPVDGGEKFNGAMIDRKGNRTEVYSYVKNANNQIIACDEVLMCSLNKGIIQVGETPVVVPPRDLIENYGSLKSASGKHSLIGCFDFKGKTALYITNNSIVEDENLTLNLSSSSGYTIIDGEKQSFNTSKLEINLTPGNAALVVIN